MDPIQTYILIEAFAINAEIEAMKAENQHRHACGNSIAYGEDAFLGKADALYNLANAIRG